MNPLLQRKLNQLEYRYPALTSIATEWYELKNYSPKEIKENRPENTEAVFYGNKFRLIRKL